jgi:hypothetical protein
MSLLSQTEVAIYIPWDSDAIDYTERGLVIIASAPSWLKLLLPENCQENYSPCCAVTSMRIMQHDKALGEATSTVQDGKVAAVTDVKKAPACHGTKKTCGCRMGVGCKAATDKPDVLDGLACGYI